MLREASLSEMTRTGIPKGSRVLVNRGRGNDELAPAEAIFRDFLEQRAALEVTLGKGSDEAHNRAFRECGYEARFRRQVTAEPAARARLAELARRASGEDVYLVCYEGPTKACHRRVLLRLAAELFGAQVAVEGVEPR